MSGEKNSRDYKGWISLVIGACAVWIAYESFQWQKNQTEKATEDSSAPGQQSTFGTSDRSSSPDTYNNESTQSDSKEEPAGNDSKQDKGHKNKKNK